MGYELYMITYGDKLYEDDASTAQVFPNSYLTRTIAKRVLHLDDYKDAVKLGEENWKRSLDDILSCIMYGTVK